MKIKCTIIDDDKVFTKILEHYIGKVEYLEHQATFNNSIDALDKVDQLKPDLIFLDMEMPEINGIQLLNTFPKSSKVIFVTKSREYGPEAFEHNAIDYLCKPVTLDRFLKCINKVKNILENTSVETSINSHISEDYLFVRNNGLWVKVAMSDINSIKADNNYIVIRTDNGDIRTNIKFKDIIDKLSQDDFMQVHRSHIVRVDKITKVDGEVLEIKNKTIPISKSYQDQLFERLHLA